MKNLILRLSIRLPLLLIGITFLLIKKVLIGVIIASLSIIIYKKLSTATDIQTKKIIKWILYVIVLLFFLGVLEQVLPKILSGAVQTGYVIIILLIVFFVNIFWGTICEYVAKNKGYSKNFFWLGFFLWFIGLIILGCMRDNTIKNDTGIISNMEQLIQLKEKGIITEAEFEESKKKILNKL